MISSKQAFIVMNAGQTVISCLTYNSYRKEGNSIFKVNGEKCVPVLFPNLKEINYHWEVKHDKGIY